MMTAAAIFAAPQDGGSPGLVLLIQFAAIIAIFYFILIRPQRKAQKRHEEMLAQLERGDRIMTDGGILGEVVHLKSDEITIKTGDNTRLIIARAKIARVFTEEAKESS